MGQELVKSKSLIKTFTRLVILIYIEHRLLNAFFFEVDKAFCANRFTYPLACFIGVNADDIELTDGILVNKVAMDLGPAESGNSAVVNAEEEALWIKPRLVHSVLEIFHDPITLVRVVGKDEVVELQPSISMDFWVEGNELIVVWNTWDGFFK